MSASPASRHFTGPGWYQFALFGPGKGQQRLFAQRYDAQFIEVLDDDGEWLMRCSHTAFDFYSIGRDGGEAAA